MEQRISVAFMGLGNRGKDAYLPEFTKPEYGVDIGGIADIDPLKVEEVARRYHVPPEKCFPSGEVMLQSPQLADAMVIATMDRQHAAQAIAAMEKGYHLLLEKPASPVLGDCQAIAQTARRTGRKVSSATCFATRRSTGW